MEPGPANFWWVSSSHTQSDADASDKAGTAWRGLSQDTSVHRNSLFPCDASSSPGQSRRHTHIQNFHGSGWWERIDKLSSYLIHKLYDEWNQVGLPWYAVTKYNEFKQWPAPSFCRWVILCSLCITVEACQRSRPRWTLLIPAYVTASRVRARSSSAWRNSAMTTATKRHLLAPVARQIAQKPFFFFFC